MACKGRLAGPRKQNCYLRFCRLQGRRPVTYRGQRDMSIQKAAKTVAKKAFVASGVLRVAHKFAAPAAVILSYHSVQDQPEQYANTIGAHCIHATSIFEWQVELIARRFNAVSMDDILLFLKGEKSLPSRAVAITFDDGYKDNAQIAAPILNRFGVPAAFYLTVDSVDRSKAPWYCFLRHAFLTSRNSKFRDPAAGTIRDLTDSQASEAAFLNAFDVCAKASASARDRAATGCGAFSRSRAVPQRI